MTGVPYDFVALGIIWPAEYREIVYHTHVYHNNQHATLLLGQ